MPSISIWATPTRTSKSCAPTTGSSASRPTPSIPRPTSTTVRSGRRDSRSKTAIAGTMTWQKELFGDNTTLIGLTFAGRSGRHFSYVFGSGGVPTFGGTFLSDFGSEGDNPGPQLFYVPTSANDPLITGDPAFLADLDRFISGNSCLAGARGSIVGRKQLFDGLDQHLQPAFPAGDPGLGRQLFRCHHRHRERRQSDQQRLGQGRQLHRSVQRGAGDRRNHRRRLAVRADAQRLLRRNLRRASCRSRRSRVCRRSTAPSSAFASASRRPGS